MRLAAIATVTVATLLSGCSSPDAARSSARPVPVDAYAALTPPPAVAAGGFDAVTVGRAQAVVHGLLAEQLLEPTTLTGSASIAADLAGAVADPAVTRALSRRPELNGLRYRPLFPAPLVLADPAARVVRSRWTTDLVQGAGGERGLRVTWAGSLSYGVATPDGVAHRVGVDLALGYVFSPLADEPSGVRLQQVQPMISTATGVLASCRTKGLLWPGTSGPCPA